MVSVVLIAEHNFAILPFAAKKIILFRVALSPERGELMKIDGDRHELFTTFDYVFSVTSKWKTDLNVAMSHRPHGDGTNRFIVSRGCWTSKLALKRQSFSVAAGFD